MVLGAYFASRIELKTNALFSVKFFGTCGQLALKIQNTE
jgi:hypothetical protein